MQPVWVVTEQGELQLQDAAGRPVYMQQPMTAPTAFRGFGLYGDMFGGGLFGKFLETVLIGVCVEVIANELKRR